MTGPRPTELRVLRVFVSSPGDAHAERQMVFRAIDTLNGEPGLSDRVVLRLVAWEPPGAAPLVATVAPQEAVNRSLGLPSQCDLVVVIFAESVGSLLDQPRRPDGGAYLSGTVYEYLEALDGHGRTGRPEVIVYRRSPLLTLSEQDPEYERRSRQRHVLKEFFDGFVHANGSWVRGYNAFSDSSQFEQRILPDLKRLIWDILEGKSFPLPARVVLPRGDSPAAPQPASAPALEPLLAKVLGLWREVPRVAPAALRRDSEQVLGWVASRLADPVFRVAVVGRWRQGKTTLINRLIGGDFLETGSGRWLAARTSVGWGGEPSARFYFLPPPRSEGLAGWPEEVWRHYDASPETVGPFELPLDRLSALLAKVGDATESRAERIEVRLPCELLRHGLELLDTPGTDVAECADGWRDALDGADFAVFVADAVAGVQPRDLPLLAREVRGRGLDPFALALTGVDKLRPAASSSAVGRTRSALRDRIAADHIFPFGLLTLDPDSRVELGRLADLLVGAAADRWNRKARSALLRLQEHGAAAFGLHPTLPQRELTEQAHRLLREYFPTPSNEHGLP